MVSGGMGSPRVAGAGGANTLPFCFPRMIVSSLHCSPLCFRRSFTTGPKWQFQKKQIPGGPHETLARLGAVTQNRRQHHLDPKATSTQGAPAPAFPPLLIQTDSKGLESLAAQKVAQTSLSSSAIWKLEIRLEGNEGKVSEGKMSGFGEQTTG